MHSRFQCAQQTGVPLKSDIVTFINARGVMGGKKTEYFDLKSFLNTPAQNRFGFALTSVQGSLHKLFCMSKTFLHIRFSSFPPTSLGQKYLTSKLILSLT